MVPAVLVVQEPMLDTLAKTGMAPAAPQSSVESPLHLKLWLLKQLLSGSIGLEVTFPQKHLVPVIVSIE